jgi:hypothetical protein
MPDLARMFDPVAPGSYAPYAGIGSRRTPGDVCDDMTAIAQALETRGFTLRSGGASGADAAFEAGTARLKEIFLPEAGWRGSSSPLHPDSIGAGIWRRAEAIAAEFHPAWKRVRHAPARARLTRDTFQVLGAALDSPSRFVIAWTEDGEASGGTGQAIRIAKANEIPVLNLRDHALRTLVLEILRSD